MKTFFNIMAGTLAFLAFVAFIASFLYQDKVWPVLFSITIISAVLFVLLPDRREKALEKKRLRQLHAFYNGKVPQARYL